MMRDMESLHKAEIALEDLQKELERARLEQENVTTEKQNLEKKLQEAGGDTSNLHTSYSDLEVSQLKAEIEVKKIKDHSQNTWGTYGGREGVECLIIQDFFYYVVCEWLFENTS